MNKVQQSDCRKSPSILIHYHDEANITVKGHKIFSVNTSFISNLRGITEYVVIFMNCSMNEDLRNYTLLHLTSNKQQISSNFIIIIIINNAFIFIIFYTRSSSGSRNSSSIGITIIKQIEIVIVAVLSTT